MQKDLFGFTVSQVPETRKRTNGIRRKAMLSIHPDDDQRRSYGADELDRLFGADRIQQGKTYHVLTGGQIDFISQIIFLIRRYGTARRVLMSAWSFGSADLLIMRRICEDGKIRVFDVITNDVLPIKHPFEHKELIRMHDDGLVSRYINHNIHGKFFLFEAESGEKIVVVSSANGTFNPRLEVATFTLDERLYDFYDKSVMNIIEFQVAKHSAITVNKLETNTPMPC